MNLIRITGAMMPKRRASCSIIRIVVLIVVALCGRSIAVAQDFEKVLFEKRVTIDGEGATVIARHIYRRYTTIDSFSWKELTPISFVALDVVWDNGERAQIFRLPAATPYEVHVEYRIAVSASGLPPQPLFDFDVWRTHAGDKLLVVWKRRVYLIDPRVAMTPVLDPLIFRQGKYDRVKRRVGPWEPMSANDYYKGFYTDTRSPLFDYFSQTDEQRRRARKQYPPESWRVITKGKIPGDGAVRVLAENEAVKVLTTGYAAIYNVKTEIVMRRPLNVDDVNLLVNAPMHPQPTPQHVVDEARRHSEFGFHEHQAKRHREEMRARFIYQLQYVLENLGEFDQDRMSTAAVAVATWMTGPNDLEALALLRKAMPKLSLLQRKSIEHELEMVAKRHMVEQSSNR